MSALSKVLVIASGNAHKVEEFRVLLTRDFPGLTVTAFDGNLPPETGLSFAENAIIKARHVARVTGCFAIGDDSGLAVDVLGGCPGIFSARWAGNNASDERNRALLLAQLVDVSSENRRAHFVCSLAVCAPENAPFSGRELVVTQTWDGTILGSEQGLNGFGYDSIFAPKGSVTSAAQLLPEEKNRLSHRAKAFAELRMSLPQFFA